MNWIFENWIQSSHCLLFMSNIFVDLRYCVDIFLPSQWRQRLYEVVNYNFKENFTRYFPVCMCWALTWLHGPVDPGNNWNPLDPVAHLDPLDPMAYKDWHSYIDMWCDGQVFYESDVGISCNLNFLVLLQRALDRYCFDLVLPWYLPF